MEDNPWIMPPEGVVEKGIQAVQRFFQDLRSAEEAGAQIETLQLLKVVVVGSSQAGKTRSGGKASNREDAPVGTCTTFCLC